MYESGYLFSSFKVAAAGSVCRMKLLKTLNNPFQGAFWGMFPSRVEMSTNPPSSLTRFADRLL